jgi:spore coat polysaccharide biosynthesis protein SpsF
MGSTRLPGKMMSDLCGRPVILRLLDRLQRSTLLDDIVVATTTQPADDPLAEAVEATGIACFRGNEYDVLGRVVEAHRVMETDLIVELTGDLALRRSSQTTQTS